MAAAEVCELSREVCMPAPGPLTDALLICVPLPLSLRCPDGGSATKPGELLTGERVVESFKERAEE